MGIEDVLPAENDVGLGSEQQLCGRPGVWKRGTEQEGYADTLALIDDPPLRGRRLIGDGSVVDQLRTNAERGRRLEV